MKFSSVWLRLVPTPWRIIDRTRFLPREIHHLSTAGKKSLSHHHTLPLVTGQFAAEFDPPHVASPYERPDGVGEQTDQSLGFITRLLAGWKRRVRFPCGLVADDKQLSAARHGVRSKLMTSRSILTIAMPPLALTDMI